MIFIDDLLYDLTTKEWEMLGNITHFSSLFNKEEEKKIFSFKKNNVDVDADADADADADVDADLDLDIDADKPLVQKNSKNLEEQKKTLIVPPHENIFQENILSGEFFKINNTAIWKIADYGPDETVYTFMELLQLLKDHSICTSTKIRKMNERNSSWNAIENYFEFSSRPIKHKTLVEDEECVEFFIKREHPRFNFSKKCLVIKNNETLEGNCISLSNGGCFIELNISSNLYQEGDHAELVIDNFYNEKELRINFIIKNLNKKGIGVQFIDINLTTLQSLHSFIEDFLFTKAA